MNRGRDYYELKALTRRNNIVRTTARVVVAGFSGVFLLSTGFAMYNSEKQQEFLQHGNDVIARAEAVLDTLQRERAYLLPGAAAPPPLVRDSYGGRREEPRAACVVPRALERNGYTARAENCSLVVQIPRGGSLSEASRLYFGDDRRWQLDWNSNPHIMHPDYVRSGERYRFDLR